MSTTTKRVRVLVRFEEVDENYEVVNTERPDNFKFGAVTNEHYGPAERIAEKLSDLVYETIKTHFPKFLEPEPSVPEESVEFVPGVGFVIEEVSSGEIPQP